MPYKQDILYLENVHVPSKSKKIKEDGVQLKTEGENYDINYHLSKTSKETKEIFYLLEEKIKQLPNASEVINQKTGITYRTTRSFAFFQFGKSYIDIQLRESRYNDPRNLVKDITHLKFGYKGLTKIKSIKDVNYIFELIKQAYEKTL